MTKTTQVIQYILWGLYFRMLPVTFSNCLKIRDNPREAAMARLFYRMQTGDMDSIAK